MGIVSIFIIALCLAIDALGVSISNCMLLYNIPLKVAIKFGLFFGGFQFIMPLIGYCCGVGLSKYILIIDNWISFGLLGVIGGKMVYESFQNHTDRDINDTHNVTSFKNLTVLAIATSIDAFAVGVTFAFESISVLCASAVIGAVAFVLSAIGAYVGSRTHLLSPAYAERFGGCVLIGIGIKILAGG